MTYCISSILLSLG